MVRLISIYRPFKAWEMGNGVSIFHRAAPDAGILLPFGADVDSTERGFIYF